MESQNAILETRIMELNEYQEEALEYAIYPHDDEIPYLALALCGEAGEAADKVKKVLRDKDGQFKRVNKKEIALELGDVLWYLSVFADELGYTLEDIAKMNLKKIEDRKQRGTLQGSGDNR